MKCKKSEFKKELYQTPSILKKTEATQINAQSVGASEAQALLDTSESVKGEHLAATVFLAHPYSGLIFRHHQKLAGKPVFR